MNRHAKLLTIGALVALHTVVGLGFDPGEMQEVELDERKLVSVPVSGARVTTISFPSPISAIDAALVTLLRGFVGEFVFFEPKVACKPLAIR